MLSFFDPKLEKWLKSNQLRVKMKIDLNKVARKIEVDNRIPLRNYYRIADNLLRQVCPDNRNRWFQSPSEFSVNRL